MSYKRTRFIQLTLIFLLTVCAAAQAAKPDSSGKQFEAYMRLRNQAFNRSVESAGIALDSQTEPWGVIMEIGSKKSQTTLTAFKDGTADLYFSDGRSIAGDADKNIAGFARDFVSSSAVLIPLMGRTLEYPLPPPGEVNFYVLSESGVFASGFVDEDDLADDMDKFSRLYRSGQELVSALRRKNGG